MIGVPVQAKTIKAADPGIGFTLEFDSPLNDTLKAVITLTDPLSQQSYTSEVTLTNAISDKTLVFVVPFGDSQYAPSKWLKYDIELYAPCTAESSYTSLSGVVLGESGRFDFYTTVPELIQDRLLQTGDMLQSADGTYVGVYQQDGNFCVYPQVAQDKDTQLPVFTSNSDINLPTYFSIAPYNEDMASVQIYQSPAPGKLISQTPFIPKPFLGNMTWTIDTFGRLCLNYGPLGFQRV
ncbi:MAG: hypothetical protein SF053_05815 [Bacteroidia bacterium]|nr:hypothetical protein [Bacteroidia bacterium]